MECGGCGVEDSGVVCGFVVEYLSETLCLESTKPVEVLLCECSRFHAACEHWDEHGVEDLQFPGCGDVGVASELAKLLESRSAFLNSCCDVSIHQANVMLVCWVLCGGCDDGA